MLNWGWVREEGVWRRPPGKFCIRNMSKNKLTSTFNLGYDLMFSFHFIGSELCVLTYCVQINNLSLLVFFSSWFTGLRLQLRFFTLSDGFP